MLQETGLLGGTIVRSNPTHAIHRKQLKTGLAYNGWFRQIPAYNVGVTCPTLLYVTCPTIEL